MPNPRDATLVLDHDFLETRGKLLEIAAVLDRIDRAPRGTASIPTLGLVRCAALSRLSAEPGPDRAETIQRIFSLDYDPDWRTKFELPRR